MPPQDSTCPDARGASRSGTTTTFYTGSFARRRRTVCGRRRGIPCWSNTTRRFCRIKRATPSTRSSPGMVAKRHIERDLSRAMEHARVLSSTEVGLTAYQRLKLDLRLVDREVSESGRTEGGEEIRGGIGFLVQRRVVPGLGRVRRPHHAQRGRREIQPGH